MLTAASTHKLKHGNKKYENEEAFRLVKDSIDSHSNKKDFDKLLKVLIKINPFKEIKSEMFIYM